MKFASNHVPQFRYCNYGHDDLSRLGDEFRNAKPFPHLVLDDFFNLRPEAVTTLFRAPTGRVGGSSEILSSRKDVLQRHRGHPVYIGFYNPGAYVTRVPYVFGGRDRDSRSHPGSVP